VTKNEHLAAVLSELAKCGVEPRVFNGGKHQRVEWQIPNKPRRVTTISGSPGDVRGLLNLRSQVRRALRADGATPRDSNRRTIQQILVPSPAAEPPPPRVERLEREVVELQDLVVELMSKLERPLSPTPDPAPACALPKLKGIKADLWQHLRYDEPRSVTQLAQAIGHQGGYVSSYLTSMKRAGLVKQLSNKRGWLKAPIP
jgi:hypothetical protein